MDKLIIMLLTTALLICVISLASIIYNAVTPKNILLTCYLNGEVVQREHVSFAVFWTSGKQKCDRCELVRVDK